MIVPLIKDNVEPEDWRFAMIVPLIKGKGRKDGMQKLYKGIMVGKIYARILEDRVFKVIEGLMMSKGVAQQGGGVWIRFSP